MNIPGFTAQASLDTFRTPYRTGSRFQQAVAAITPAGINSCVRQCILGDCREWWFDCHFECGTDRYCLLTCLNRNYYPCVNNCYAQCAGN
jgi:hypothetical protein